MAAMASLSTCASLSAAAQQNLAILGVTTNPFDFVGVLLAEPQFGVASVRVQNFLANDGGWRGPTAVVAGGAPLTGADRISPQVQVTPEPRPIPLQDSGAAALLLAQRQTF